MEGLAGPDGLTRGRCLPGRFRTSQKLKGNRQAGILRSTQVHHAGQRSMRTPHPPHFQPTIIRDDFEDFAGSAVQFGTTPRKQL